MSLKSSNVCITWPTPEGEQTRWITIDVDDHIIAECHGDMTKLFRALTKVVHAEYPHHSNAHVFDWKGLHRY